MSRLPAFIPAVVAVAALLLASSAVRDARTASAQPGAIPLDEALRQGLVTVEFTGNGSASGASVVLTISRRVASDLTITVPLGLLLRNEEIDEQDMVVRRLLGETTDGEDYLEATVIHLHDDEPHDYLLEAYCLELELDNPSEGARFGDGGFAHPDVVAALGAVARVPDAERIIEVIQAAVWAVTDDASRDDLDDVGYVLSDREVRLVESILREAGLDPARFRLVNP